MAGVQAVMLDPSGPGIWTQAKTFFCKKGREGERQ